MRLMTEGLAKAIFPAAWGVVVIAGSQAETGGRRPAQGRAASS